MPAKPPALSNGPEIHRCGWCGTDPDYLDYHDLEWGVPLHEENRLFEMMVLEGMQSGLSWLTILKKRPAFRTAFAGFDPVKVAKFGPEKVTELLGNAAIIRNRAKIDSVIVNAQTTLIIQKKFGSLDQFIWSFVDGQPIVNHRLSYKEAPATTPLSEKFAKECRLAGFRFIGPTVAYAFMQAIGMVNDHEVGCFRHPDFSRPKKTNLERGKGISS